MIRRLFCYLLAWCSGGLTSTVNSTVYRQKPAKHKRIFIKQFYEQVGGSTQIVSAIQPGDSTEAVREWEIAHALRGATKSIKNIRSNPVSPKKPCPLAFFFRKWFIAFHSTLSFLHCLFILLSFIHSFLIFSSFPRSAVDFRDLLLAFCFQLLSHVSGFMLILPWSHPKIW